jgi:hypothetical protein
MLGRDEGLTVPLPALLLGIKCYVHTPLSLSCNHILRVVIFLCTSCSVILYIPFNIILACGLKLCKHTHQLI